MRTVPHDEARLVEHYSDLMEALGWPEVVEDDRGVYRFAANRLFRWMTEATDGSNPDPRSLSFDPPRPHRVSLNDMAIGFQRGAFSLEEYMAFYRGLGYSLDGFIEVFGERLGLFEE